MLGGLLNMPDTFDKFTEYLELKGLSAGTKKHYLYYFVGFGDLSKFNQAAANKFVLEHNNHPAVRAFITNLRTFLLSNCEELGFNEEVIRKVELAAKTGARAKKIPDYIAFDELGPLEQGFTNERNKLMMWYSFYGGLRVSELVNIGIYDFKVNWFEIKELVESGRPLSTAILIITGKRKKQRPAYIPGKLLKRTYLWLANHPIPGKYGENSKIFEIGVNRWQELVVKAGRKALEKKIHAHMFRHGCATWLHNLQGWDLKEIATYLGIESVSTVEIYTHIENKKLKSKFDSIFA